MEERYLEKRGTAMGERAMEEKWAAMEERGIEIFGDSQQQVIYWIIYLGKFKL